MKTNKQLEILETAILNRSAIIGVMGLGYVGLPLVRAIVSKGYNCVGFDTDTKKIEMLRNSKTYIRGVSDEDILSLNESKLFSPSNDVTDLAKMDLILICVPTPLTKNREPDMKFVISATEIISKQLRKNQLVILESTTYPGTTSELLTPILERSGLKASEDFYLAYSPEREDPGNINYDTSSIPKIVGADDLGSKKLALLLYRQITSGVIGVSTLATAEAVKLTENIFRFVNIAFVNELKCIYDKMGIDIWEVIEAAKTKPFGYMPFYPGPGIGGHCIPVDPFYLTWKAREFGMATQLVELCGQINSHMPLYVIEKLRKELDLRFEKGLSNTHILVIGVSYKKNVDDLRESPSLVIMEELVSNKAKIDYYDPLVENIGPDCEHPSLIGMKSIILTNETLKSYHAVLISTDHDDIDYKMILDNSALIVDTRNALKNRDLEGDNVVKA